MQTAVEEGGSTISQSSSGSDIVWDPWQPLFSSPASSGSSGHTLSAKVSTSARASWEEWEQSTVIASGEEWQPSSTPTSWEEWEEWEESSDCDEWEDWTSSGWPSTITATAAPSSTKATTTVSESALTTRSRTRKHPTTSYGTKDYLWQNTEDDLS